MTKLEYSDFYKFLVSLGIILISLAFLLPWLFLRESFDSLVTTSEIADLTPTAQALILYRQSTALWFIQNTVWISSILMLAGLGFLITGIFLWAKQQNIRDQKEKLETEKLRREIENMTPAQILEKGIKEAEEEETTEDVAPKEVQETEQTSVSPSTGSIIKEYFRIEEVIINKLKACFYADDLLANKRIRQTEYDAILQSSHAQLVDIIFEIKYSEHEFTLGRVRQTTNQLTLNIQTYVNVTERNAVGVAFFVSSQEPSNVSRMNRVMEIINEEAELHNVKIIAYFVSKDQLAKLSCRDLKRMVYPSNDVLRR